ncbi:hypothetical protein GCM10020331_087840 [Ectobacillus funiculus]
MDCKSIMGVMSLAIREGEAIREMLKKQAAVQLLIRHLCTVGLDHLVQQPTTQQKVAWLT